MELQNAKEVLQSPHFQEVLQLHQSGNIQEAIAHYQSFLEQYPKEPQLVYLLGTAYCQSGELEQAIALLKQSLELNPDNAFAYNNLGNAYQEKKQKVEALQCYEQAIRYKPDYVSAFFNRGNLLNELGQQPQALASYAEAIRLQPNYVEALREYAGLLREMGQEENALEIFAQAIQSNPDNADTHFQKAITLKKLGRVYQAIESYIEATRCNSQHTSALYNLGNIYLDLGDHHRAVEQYSKALQTRPNYPEAYLNRGNAFKALGMMQESLNDYSEAIKLNPAYADAYSNRGNLHKDNGRVEPALSDYEQALTLRPDYAEVHWNKALLLIVKGEYEQGWQLYEWRLRMASYQMNCQTFPVPEWRDLEEIAGKRVLVYAEQGYGDAIQFCRYLTQVRQHCQQLIVQVHVALIPLLKTLDTDITFVAKGDALPAFDAYCPLMSLPYVCKTTLENVPASVPYLQADTAKIQQWRHRLSTNKTLRVGLAWTGSSKHDNDINRSIALQNFEQLLQANVEWHSLQKEYRLQDQTALNQFKQIQHHQNDLNDFADTAALIECLDLVITVDTSVAHVAGALGKPVWILLPYAPDYRWLLNRTDSPWYPSAVLFRQTAYGDWQTVLGDLLQQFNQWIAQAETHMQKLSTLSTQEQSSQKKNTRKKDR